MPNERIPGLSKPTGRVPVQPNGGPSAPATTAPSAPTTTAPAPVTAPLPPNTSNVTGTPPNGTVSSGPSTIVSTGALGQTPVQKPGIAMKIPAEIAHVFHKPSELSVAKLNEDASNRGALGP